MSFPCSGAFLPLTLSSTSVFVSLAASVNSINFKRALLAWQRHYGGAKAFRNQTKKNGALYLPLCVFLSSSSGRLVSYFCQRIITPSSQTPPSPSSPFSSSPPVFLIPLLYLGLFGSIVHLEEPGNNNVLSAFFFPVFSLLQRERVEAARLDDSQTLGCLLLCLPLPAPCILPVASLCAPPEGAQLWGLVLVVFGLHSQSPPQPGWWSCHAVTIRGAGGGPDTVILAF